MTSIDSFLLRVGKIHNTSLCITEDVFSRCITTLREMLYDRKCTNINGVTTYAATIHALQEATVILSGTQSNGSLVEVFFHNEDRLGVKQMRNWAENSAAETLIIISLDGPTSFTKRETETCPREIQFFTFKELCVNITRHKLVPKHEIVDQENMERVVVLKKPECLPKLYSNDKVALYYNFKPGNIIRITRKIAYSEPVVYYRLVVTPVN
jgi:DNA-directed RNA polymerase subunit H (RpoH/RPB5)